MNDACSFWTLFQTWLLMQTRVWCEKSKIVLSLHEMFTSEGLPFGGWKLFRCQNCLLGFFFSQLFQFLLQMLTRSYFYFISLIFASFSRWRFTFYLSIFFYGIRFLWTVSWSVTPLPCSVWRAAGLWLSCWNTGAVTTCVTSSVLAPSLKQGGVSGDSHLYIPLFEILGFLFKDLLYTLGKLLYRSVIMEVLETYLSCYPRLGQNCWGFFAMESCLSFCYLPLEGIQFHLFGSLLLLELYDYSLNFRYSITCLWLQKEYFKSLGCFTINLAWMIESR